MHWTLLLCFNLAAEPEHWAFRPVARPVVPASAAAHPIDAFVLARLSQKLTPSPEADRRTLIRRLSFDLLGLPPTPAEIDAFRDDARPDAYERLVDRLISSPRYGERQARHWLDLARYADNKGYVFFEDKNYPWAWAYRDFVIDSFNRDQPYDRFVLEQIAADQVGGDQRSLAALGFLTVGGHFMGNTHDIIDDRIDVVTRGLMGLTVSCARCHDHKYDPVSTADYYSLYGVFRSSVEPMVPPLLDAPPNTDEYRAFAAELTERERKLAEFVASKHLDLVTQARARAGDYLYATHLAREHPLADDFMLIADKGDLNPAMIARYRAYLEATHKRRDPAWKVWHRYAAADESAFATIAHEAGENSLVLAAFATPPKTMREVAQRYAKLLAEAEKEATSPAAVALRAVLHGPTSPADAPLDLDWGSLSLFPDRATQAEYQKLIKEVETHAAKGPPRAMVLRDSERPHEPRVFVRGQPNRLGDLVPRQFLSALDRQRKPFTIGSGRLELARAIASRDNPLTARVMVNRMWMQHFGRGLVNTPGDFGLRGDAPTHPELLDWLADEFRRDWSVKRLHRLIVTSATYRQASGDRDDALAADPENRWLWRQNRRRLEFEPLRDSMLAIAGHLDSTIGGPEPTRIGSRPRRTIYGKIDRLEFPSLLATFDVPNPAATAPERTQTTVAPQALYLMNSPFARDAAKQWLAAPAIAAIRDPAEKVEALFRMAFGRGPTPTERARSLALVARGPERWLDLAHGLMMANECAFVD